MSVYNNLIEKLVKAGIPSPRLEAKLLLSFVLGDNGANFFDVELSDKQQDVLDELVNKRVIDRFPLDKIIGRKGFYKYEFVVNEDVLSPRPDTEVLLEKALELSPKGEFSALDLGVGSGCILLSILKENPNACGVGVDVSEKALDVARQNSKNLGVENQVSFINASWFDSDFVNLFDEKFDIIVTNPPYIPDDDILRLEPEVKNHDPMLALSGGVDGLVSYHRIAEVVPLLLKDNGYVLIEGGINQADDSVKNFTAQNLNFCEVVKDLSGIDRCVILKK